MCQVYKYQTVPGEFSYFCHPCTFMLELLRFSDIKVIQAELMMHQFASILFDRNNDIDDVDAAQFASLFAPKKIISAFELSSRFTVVQSYSSQSPHRQVYIDDLLRILKCVPSYRGSRLCLWSTANDQGIVGGGVRSLLSFH